MPEPSILFVILMGVGIVFIGLVCIVFLTTAMSAICGSMGEKTPVPSAGPAAPAAPAAQPEAAIPNRQAMIAAIAVAIAEDLGTDPGGIRILSVKKQ